MSYAIKQSDGHQSRLLARTWNIRDAAVVARALANAHGDTVTVHCGAEYTRVSPGIDVDECHTAIAVASVAA